jgi:hypothetical protein
MACIVPSDAGAGDAADATPIDGGDTGSTSVDASDAEVASSSSDAGEVGDSSDSATDATETADTADAAATADTADAAATADTADATATADTDVEDTNESDADADLRDSAEVGPFPPTPNDQGSGGCGCEAVGALGPPADRRVAGAFALLAMLVVAGRRRRSALGDGRPTNPRGGRGSGG